MEAENTPDEQPDDLTAAQILERVRGVYATCATYEDAEVAEEVSVFKDKSTCFRRKNFIVSA